MHFPWYTHAPSNIKTLLRMPIIYLQIWQACLLAPACKWAHCPWTVCDARACYSFTIWCSANRPTYSIL